MEFFTDYLGVFTSAAVAAIAAGFGGFIWKRVQTLNNFLKREEAKSRGSVATRMTQLEEQVRDLKVIAADALARAGQALEAVSVGEDEHTQLNRYDRERLQDGMVEDLKDFHQRLANVLSFPAEEIDSEHVAAVRDDLKTLDRTVHVLRDQDLEPIFHVYRAEAEGLIDALVSATAKTAQHTKGWAAVTESFAILFERVNGSISEGTLAQLSKFSIKTSKALQSWDDA